MPDPKPAYEIADKQSIVMTPDVRATVMTLDPGQEIPWHSHTKVTDTSFCLEGRIEITFKGPDEAMMLPPGQWVSIPPGRLHRVRCLGPNQGRVLLVQGVGAYDFVPA